MQVGPVCTFGRLRLDASIPGGRLSGCEQIDVDHVRVRIDPEADPINPSPWYAFEVSCEGCGPVRIDFTYGAAEHRYDPLAAALEPDAVWSPLAAVNEELNEAGFLVDASAGPVRVAARTPYAPERHAALLSDLADTLGGEVQIIGRSVQNRPISALSITGGTSRTALLMLGGQHPPETGGAEALEAFARRIAADEPLARRWRDLFGLVIIPDLNPDGTALGHWRLNAGLVDLNRDWGPFTQPETRAAADFVATLPLAMMIDFHGTRRDVLYSLPDCASGSWPDFAVRLDASLAARLGPDAPPRSGAHRGGSGVAKGWFHETYAIPTLTYEVGDETPLHEVRREAIAAAEAIMALMLDYVENPVLPQDCPPNGAPTQ